MPTAAGIVLAGGCSSRMGAPKTALEWHGSTLLRHVVGLAAGLAAIDADAAHVLHGRAAAAPGVRAPGPTSAR